MSRLSALIGFAIVGTLVWLAPAPAESQPYRIWYDSTDTEVVVPKHIGIEQFPIGLFIYAYDWGYPVEQVWDYASMVNADHVLFSVERGTAQVYDKDLWLRYNTLLDNTPSGSAVVPLVYYDVSTTDLIGSSREVTFYPFDSSQLGGIANTGASLLAYRHGYSEHRFASFQYDSTDVSGSHGVSEYKNGAPQSDEDVPRREVFYSTGLAGEVVASGLAFHYDTNQTERWDQTFDGTSWNATANPINSSAFFDGVGFGSVKHPRSPHYLVLTGRILESVSPAPDTAALLRIDVYFEVDRGRTYRDSTAIANDTTNVQTADTNLRFLYKSFFITRADLKPVEPLDPDWNAHVSTVRQIDFEKEGMGGPTDEYGTARSIDIEITYLGGETVVLHSLSLRDHYAHSTLREDAAGDTFRSQLLTQIDSIVRATGATYPKTVDTAIHNTYIADEPEAWASLPYRRAKQQIEENYVFANGDSLTTLVGWAMPHAQWTGQADWSANGSYYSHYFSRLGERFGFYKSIGSDSTLMLTVPSEKSHNGGRYHIPEFFDLTQLGDAAYAASMPARIDSMENILQHARLGAAVPGQKGDDTWLVQSLYESAMWARKSGKLHYHFVGPVSALRIDILADTTIDGGDTTITYTADTLAEHRPEAAEIRGLIGMALAYGTKMLAYYTFESKPWAYEAPGGLIGKTNLHSEIGYSGREAADSAFNIVDWPLIDPDLGKRKKILDDSGNYTGSVELDTLGHIPDLYVAWRSLTREMQSSNAWARRVAARLVDLHWRDAYSIHFQTNTPVSDYDDTILVHRPLPSDEIITEVTARHPITGVVDSSWATFVEVGLFDTKLGYDEVEQSQPMRDSNFALIVNRRGFETGNYDTADVMYSDTVRALLDTLSETRTIRVRFNLGHPDSTQYSFIRVREIEPDTVTPLPLIGIRTGLDTVVRGDSAIEITLGAGRSALLEITYAEPDTSIIDGLLHWNNQRKMIYFDDDRYHATYLRNDSVLHRRSIVMGPNPASILWEPSETVVSIGPQRTTTQNWTPSITGSVHNGDTVVTIVWTCHSDSSGVRDVVLHDLLLNGGGQPVQQSIRHIDYHSGTDSTQVGDAVVAAMHGGDVIAWGDSQLGVVSRVRLRSAPGAPTVLSNRSLVSQPYHDTVNNRVGKWPALPSFAHRASADSNVAIVWNQPIGTGVNARIYYQRVLQNPIVGTVPGIALLNFTPVSWNPSPIGRPSIDQTQDLWHRLQEGITFSQDRGATTSDLIWYRSMWTSVNAGPDGDTINATQAWSTASLEGPNGGGGFTFDTYPTASSLNDYMVLADTSGYAHFAIAWVDRWAHYYSGELYTYQANMQYAMDTFRLGWPQVYTFGGDDPQGTASPLAQKTRHAVLYETEIDGSDVMRTTRQFFAKSRPTGYVAKGRRTIVPIDLNSSTYIELLVHDPWIADDAGGTALSWAPRDPSKKTDSVHQVEELLRSVYFSAGDSTAVGLEMQAFFHGDSAEAPTARISLIAELVDSTNGSVIKQLDSIGVTAAADSQHVVLDPEYDLLSSTYYIRVRLDTADLDVAPSESNQEIFHVSEYASLVPDPPAAKFARRLGPSTGNGLRISAQPNPFDERTEIRFSIPESEEVSIVVIDNVGREVMRLVEGAEYRAGRWAVEFVPGQLPSGSYIVELRAGRERAVERVIVR